MYCKNCGKQIDDDSKFCSECGASVSLGDTTTKSSENVLSKPITVKNTPWPTSKPQSKRERIKENKQNGVACCPKCGSTSLSANKKGFGIGKAVVGAALTGGIGLVAGNIGAKKVWVTCLNCGHRWKM
jgi:RNA polymerase subunit RPABC4/transcription elongation factor Spt4